MPFRFFFSALVNIQEILALTYCLDCNNVAFMAIDPAAPFGAQCQNHFTVANVNISTNVKNEEFLTDKLVLSWKQIWIPFNTCLQFGFYCSL